MLDTQRRVKTTNQYSMALAVAPIQQIVMQGALMKKKI
jgi:hypothetical protein